MTGEPIELSIVIPALNEEKTVGICVRKALKAIAHLRVRGEVIVADNGSVDRTRKVAEEAGACVFTVKKRGYGNALWRGFRGAKGKYIIMGDADNSYNFEEIAPFYYALNERYDFVVGNRFKGKIEKGAMPFLNRYFGTPALTGLMNLFFKTGIGDTNCGMRGFKKIAIGKMRLKTGGMEFASEMIIKASLARLKIKEVPCNLYRSKRDDPPHLNIWRDGWLHLRFMLLFTPTWTFLIPGLFLSFFGLLGMSLFVMRDIFNLDLLSSVGGKQMVTCMIVFLTGCQIVFLGIIAKLFSFSKYFDYGSWILRFLDRYFSVERAIIFGFLLIAVGFLVFLYLQISFHTDLLPWLSESIRFDMGVIAATNFLIGIQIIFTSFVMSLFFLKIK